MQPKPEPQKEQTPLDVEDEETKKLKHQLEEEKLKNEIHKLKASTVEIWVKEIKSIVLLGIFILGTVVNAVSYILTLMGKKALEAMPTAPMAGSGMTGVGSGGGGASMGGAGIGEGHVAMAMASNGFDIIELLKNMAGSHTLWQIVLFAVLIPIAIDWYKKRKKQEANRDASTSPSTDENKH